MIQSDDEKVNAFVFNLEENELDQVVNGNIYQFVAKVIKDCDNKVSHNKELWIPAFQK